MQQFLINGVVQFDADYGELKDEEVIDILRDVLGNQDIKAAITVEAIG